MIQKKEGPEDEFRRMITPLVKKALAKIAELSDEQHKRTSVALTEAKTIANTNEEEAIAMLFGNIEEVARDYLGQKIKLTGAEKKDLRPIIKDALYNDDVEMAQAIYTSLVITQIQKWRQSHGPDVT